VFTFYKGSARTDFRAKTLAELIGLLDESNEAPNPSERAIEAGDCWLYDPQEWNDLVATMKSDPEAEADEWLSDTGMPEHLFRDQLILYASPGDEAFDASEDDWIETYRLFEGDLDIDGVNAVLARQFPDCGYHVVAE